MKFLSTVFLFLFIAFLATPTLIGMVDKEADTSYFYTMCEEEENHSLFNEIKTVQTTNYSVVHFSFGELVKLNVLIEHDLLSFDNLAHQIFSPPPNLA
ncbi:hypothetical protein [Flavobacterium cheniae]|uniref:Uncharacterized protein n=1 Tax=Flavobacterium cheniae TaxID=295428 RepID=A0A562KJJ1_9FLAO|nr:hypothetical protein [Flavobacterium cheniae]TDR25955.1 hypothetical protein C8D80_0746 [Flavobacterium cheniae]TWH95562.1 hypothetical protein IP97_01240 [Flavobacterium cheniae]